jgi:transposase
MNVLSEFKATIGLDWADQKHDLWIRPADGSKAEHTRLEQSPEALHEWVAALRARFPEGRVALGIETARGPVISALLAYDFMVIFPINPKALKDYRACFSVSGAKRDRTDAQLIEEYVRLHGEKLKALQPDDALTRELGGLTESRRQLVDERTRLINQLHARLKTYYPLALALLGREMNTVMAAEFLALWPDLESLQAASPQKVRSFFYKHNSRSQKKMEERLLAIKRARALTSDAAIIQPARALVGALAAMLKCLHKSVAQLEKKIEQAMEEHPDGKIFRSFPGAGPALAPRLLAAFGTRRERFESAAAVAQFYGIAPVVIQSGNSCRTRMRQRCPKFGRQTFHENAACAAKSEDWARRYYEGHRQRHADKHHEACRSLAYKLIRIYFACWKNQTEYREDTYLAALKKSGSPLGAEAASSGE